MFFQSFSVGKNEHEEQEEKIIMEHLEAAFAALVVGPERRVEIVSEHARELKDGGEHA